MSALNKTLAETDLHRLQQTVKWIVYTLLLVNFAFYIYEDWNRAIHTLTEDAGPADWAAEFATSIDEAGWFILLFMFELETYALEDEEWKGWVAHTVRALRLACYVMLAHTVVAYADTVAAYTPTVPVDGASSLCEIADRDVSWVYNLEYTAVDADNCAGLSDAERLYWLGEDPLVTSASGLTLERQLAWADLVEAVAWLLIVLSIEVVVRLQDRGVTGGPVIRIANALKIALYLLLLVIAAWWASLSHWLYAWDEFVWIAGFAVIEMNVNEWRDELVSGTAENAA